MLDKMVKIDDDGCIDCHTNISHLSSQAKRCRSCALKHRTRKGAKAYHIRKLKARKVVPTMLVINYLKELHINIEWEYLITG